MADPPLEERFPDLRPIKGPPSLSTVNGIGLAAYGTRDYDPETGTYVKTHCFCVLFVPLLAVGAYRVLDAPGGGWYFLGKVPLSLLAKLWNIVVVGGAALAIGLVLWLEHTGSADYVARQKLAEAERLADAGQLGQAARLCAEVAGGKTAQAGAAVTKLEELLARPVDAKAVEQAAEAFQVAVDLQGRRAGALPGLFERGLKVAVDHEQAQPRGVMLVLEAIAPLAPQPDQQLTDRQAAVLERLVAAEPNNVDYAIRLALVCERRKQPERCDKLLTPHRQKLESTEGARILGQLRAAQGKLDEAQTLLTSYTEPRLDKLRNLDQARRQLALAAEERLVNKLKAGKAEGFDYAHYKRLGQDDQDKMVNAYIVAHLRDDDALRKAQQAVMRERGAIDAALDLGLVLLRRAQALEPAARRAALEKAEQTFLAVRGVAGQSEEVNLNLGEVYYWLGKQANGKKLFDELLKARPGDVGVQLKVGGALRRVGARFEARALAEKAYHATVDAKLQKEAAYFRSVLATDLKDAIEWLQRSNLNVPDIKAALSTALGRQAMEEGKEEEAAQHVRAAIAEYDRLPPNASTLNNGALAYIELYLITGERADMDRANIMLDKALALMPSDSILLINAAEFTMEAALHDLIGPALDFKALRGTARPQLLSYLYADRAGRDRLAGRLRQHALLGKAIQHYERLLVLAPRDPRAGGTLAALYALTNDVAALRRVDERLRAADLDLERSSRETLDFYAGKNLAKGRAEHASRLGLRQKALAAARKAGGATLAVAASELSNELSRTDALGLPLDADEVVRLAEEADKAAPSRATRSSLSGALLIRAGQRLTARDATYAAWVAKARRSLGHSQLIALALLEGGKPRAVLLANADVRRALDLVRAAASAFPDEPSAWAWAMLHATHPEDAAQIAKAATGDKAGALMQSLSAKLGPSNGPAAMTEYFTLRMTGHEDQARAALRRAAKQGVPLPFAP